MPKRMQWERGLRNDVALQNGVTDGEIPMRRPAGNIRLSWALTGCVAIAVCSGGITLSAAQSHAGAAPLFGIAIPPGYRDWKLVSVAHEAGTLNDIRAILGNDVAIRAYREGKAAFPDGAIIARIAWRYESSADNNKVFGKDQSFVAGAPTEWYLQLMVKDSRKYSATHGWGFAQFDQDGKPADDAKLRTCMPCHEPASASDFVFTRYAR